MTNITLATLAGIPEVNQAAIVQNSPDSSGAYAIIAAVGAHGAFPQAAALAYANGGPQVVNNNANIYAADNYTQLSAAVYMLTGILNNAAGTPVVPELLAAGHAYNSPAAMAQVAMSLGRPAPQINAQAAGFADLNARYPNEWARCNGVVGAVNVNVAAGPYAAPAANATHVVCVTAIGGGLHWLAQGSDGRFYDPSDGSLNNAWAPVNTGDAMGSGIYTFAGLWMSIK